MIKFEMEGFSGKPSRGRQAKLEFFEHRPVHRRFPQSDQPVWHYQVGTDLRDHFARLVSWYTKGGFTDELGARHESGHHDQIDYWEVLNEPDFEHDTTPEQYTARYDAIVSAIRGVNLDKGELCMSHPSPIKLIL